MQLSLMTLLAAAAGAQSNSATVSGTVTDTTGAVLPDADLRLVDDKGATQRRTLSGKDGGFVFASLPPGSYVLRASLSGFGSVELRDVVLNVDDRIRLSVQLTVGTRGEEVTVVAEAHRVNTSPSVSTVIDRQFVENLPLNGRSLQSLLELTPGVTLTAGGGGSVGNISGNGGQFSVNGQRTNANYFTVDGVSANTGIISATTVGAEPGQSGSGQLPAFTALGTTSSLVSVDALQEFRIQTSTYAPEFGRTPGGQVSMITRSGTNAFHGSVSDYFRHEALNATDWFTNNRGLPKPKMRQHNFGGVFGGPLLRSRMFFFASYEGLRLDLPRSFVTQVPSLELRRMASPAIQPYLHVFPVPNGRDLGNGMAELAMAISDPQETDATSLRLDHRIGERLSFFGRVSYAPSSASLRLRSHVDTRHSDNVSFTFGSTWLPSVRVVHDFRVNYTSTAAPETQQPDDWGGAVPLPLSIFAAGRTPQNALFDLGVGSTVWRWGVGPEFVQRSFNIVDSLTAVVGSHEAKVGLDARVTNAVLGGQAANGLEVLRFTAASIANGRPSLYQHYTTDPGERVVLFKNISVFAQDDWKLTSRLTAMYGVRWDLAPSPRAIRGDDATPLENLDRPYDGQVHFGQPGTALWKTRFGNIAPRAGVSYLLRDRPQSSLLMRGGVGRFYDLGFGQVTNAFVAYPFLAVKSFTSPEFPLSATMTDPPLLGTGNPLNLWAMDRNIEAPYTLQWNLSIEQNLGRRQTLTLSYVGAEGRKLLKLDRHNINMLEWPAQTTSVYVNRNLGYSDYRALQMQFQRRLHQGVQSIVSYTYSRARDTSSGDSLVSVPAQRIRPEMDYGYADFDVRHVLTGAVTWQIPDPPGPTLMRAIGKGWGADVLLRARSGAPMSLTTSVPFPPDRESVRPNVVPGQPFWIDDPAAPGGRRLNREAFAIPAAGTQGNLVRGTVRGFGARQIDLALRRSLALSGGIRMQIRLEMFNLLNTPMFANPFPSLDSGGQFGQSTATLNNSLGGLVSFYQLGGSRATQIAAKLEF